MMTEACDKQLDLVVLNGLFHTERVGCNLFLFFFKVYRNTKPRFKDKQEEKVGSRQQRGFKRLALAGGFPCSRSLPHSAAGAPRA